MNRKSWVVALFLLCVVAVQAREKEIYIPAELRAMDLESDTALWSMQRTAQSDNFVVFWERGFGHDLARAPRLEGHDMTVDVKHLLDRLETFYAFYRDTLRFVHAGSKSERYKMLVMLRYSLEGTAYGGDYDGEIGALWVAPNRLRDTNLNCMAHELGHCFQSQIRCDGEAGHGHLGGFFEMTSQWMLWQVNPQWMKEEEYHWEAFMQQTHLPLFDGQNIYHSPYVLEYWGWRHGRTVMGDLYRNVGEGEDPAETYKRTVGLTQEQFNDEIFDCYRRLVCYDMPRVREVAVPYAGRWDVTSLELGNYGFNVHTLDPFLAKTPVKVTITGEGEGAAQWTWGFVAEKADGTIVYGEKRRGTAGTVRFRPSKKEQYKHLWLVVAATPATYLKGDERYPYKFFISNN